MATQNIMYRWSNYASSHNYSIDAHQHEPHTPTFSKDTRQSLHNSAPTSMFGTLGGNNHRGGWYIHFALPSTICNIGEPLHFRRKRYLASSLASEGPWRLSNLPRSVEIRLNQIIIKLSADGVRFPVKDSLHRDTHTSQTVRPATKIQTSTNLSCMKNESPWAAGWTVTAEEHTFWHSLNPHKTLCE